MPADHEHLEDPDQLLIARIRLKRLATRGETPAADLAEWIEAEFGWPAEHGSRPDASEGSWNRLPSGRILDAWRPDREILAVDDDGFVSEVPQTRPDVESTTEPEADAAPVESEAHDGDGWDGLPTADVALPSWTTKAIEKQSESTEPKPKPSKRRKAKKTKGTAFTKRGKTPDSELREPTEDPPVQTTEDADNAPAETPVDADEISETPDSELSEPAKGTKPKRKARRTLTRASAALVAVLVVISLIPAIGAATGQFALLPVRSSSMEPTLGKGSLAFATPVEAATLDVNDVIAFDPPTGGDDVIHAVASTDESRSGDQIVIATQGTANPNPDPWELRLDGNEDVLLVRDEIPGIGWVLVALTSNVVRALLAGAAIIFAAFAVRAARKERDSGLHALSLSSTDLADSVEDWLNTGNDDEDATEPSVNA